MLNSRGCAYLRQPWRDDWARCCRGCALIDQTDGQQAYRGMNQCFLSAVMVIVDTRRKTIQ